MLSAVSSYTKPKVLTTITTFLHYTPCFPVMLDHQSGFMSPLGPAMLVPVGNIQSKGLPSNGVVGNGGASPPPLQRDDLKAALMQQVEYYFSKDNLATDKYLCK